MAINIRQTVKMGKIKSSSLIPGDNPKFIEAFTTEKVSHSYNGNIESGLGSSASLAVALVAGQAKLEGIDMSPEDIAEKAWNIEVNNLGLYGGKQDQYAAAFGGVNFMEFTRAGVQVIPLSEEFIAPLIPYMTLFYTGLKRKDTKIQENFKEMDDEQVVTVTILKNLAQQAVEPIGQGNIEKVAELLNQAWEIKKQSNKGVSNSEIDRIYEVGIKTGALGGKLLGSGGGGHILWLVAPDKRQEFIKNMEKGQGLTWVDFEIDWEGVKVEVEK